MLIDPSVHLWVDNISSPFVRRKLDSVFLSCDCNKLGNISIQKTSDNNIFFPSNRVWHHNHHSTLHLYLRLSVVDYGVECGDAAELYCWLKCCTKPNIHALLEMLNKIFNSVNSVKLGWRYLKVLKQSFLGRALPKIECTALVALSVRPSHRLSFVISKWKYFVQNQCKFTDSHRQSKSVTIVMLHKRKYFI